MPTAGSSKIPPPKSSEEFEEITLDALKRKWDSPGLQKVGRNGQAQNGVDIYGKDNLGNPVGIQCKNTDGLTLEIIKKEIAKAEEFKPALKVFYIATSAGTDAKLQKQVRLLTQERVQGARFPIGIWFWNDLIQEIVSNNKYFKKHYPHYNVSDLKNKPSSKLYSVLDLAFYGLNLNYYQNLLFGEMGFMVQEDPEQMEIICGLINTASMEVLDETLSSKINQATKAYLEYVMPYVKGKSVPHFHWKNAKDMGDNIERLVRTIDATFDKREMSVFTLGSKLATWEKFECHADPDDFYDQSKLTQIQKYISAVFGRSVPPILLESLNKYKTGNDHARLPIPTRMYNQIRHLLIDLELFDDF